MKLTKEEQAFLNGEKGPTMKKILQSVIDYGEIFGADSLVDITNNGHFVISMGVSLFTPFYLMLDEIIESGLKTKGNFTVDPFPVDHANVKSNLLQKVIFKVLYKAQPKLDDCYSRLGIKDKNAYSCTCYLPEVGNIPKRGDILAWSESSAVVFANSVIGARCNRNSGGIDILMNIIGKTPVFDLITDEGRKAKWLIQLETTTKPNPQLLGSAIGLKVMEDVPYIVGLDKYLGQELNEENKAYLKDMGAASASNGAVGLYHVENLTPEAKELGKKLLIKDYKTYIINEKKKKKVYSSYPNIWKNTNAKPKKCFIGCPHLSLQQLYNWTDSLANEFGKKKIPIETILLAAPDVVAKFKADTNAYSKLITTGAKLSSICPLMYMANPLCKDIPIITNSNKLRTYTTSRFFPDEKLIEILKRGAI